MSDRSCSISRLFTPERATAKSSRWTQQQLDITPGRAFHRREIHHEEEENNRTGYGLKGVRIKSMAIWAKEE